MDVFKVIEIKFKVVKNLIVKEGNRCSKKTFEKSLKQGKSRFFLPCGNVKKTEGRWGKDDKKLCNAKIEKEHSSATAVDKVKKGLATH